MPTFDPQHHPFSSKRQTVHALNGMVATTQPLAAQAGLDMLKQGGNAIDAAIATAAMLTVVEPTSNGIGGDAFAIVHHQGKLHGLNGSGRSPKSLTIDAVKARGHDTMPKFGVVPVTVPGVPAAWASLAERFGTLPLKTLLAPAIHTAKYGFPVSPTVAHYWHIAARSYQKSVSKDDILPWLETFTNSGKTPAAGSRFLLKDHAKTLEAIAQSNASAFYKGHLAEKITAYFKSQDGFLSADDLATHQSEWVDPIHTVYRGHEVWELPPNTQGAITLQALNILKALSFEKARVEETLHKQIEALKLAFSDGLAYISDPAHMPHRITDLLDDTYAKHRAAQIGAAAMNPSAGRPPKGGTVYLATADQDGNMVSYIQSNYMGFGSGIVIPGTGIAMQNRGHTFSLDKDHVNALAPGKKTYHTIIPGFLTKDGQAIGPFGVMGGFMQPQGHLQVIMNTLDFNLNPQAALDAPRWYWEHNKIVHIEATMPQTIIEGLKRRGHDVKITADVGPFGRGQIIWRDPITHVLSGGTEMRADGSIACF
ncbi:MAG: gamma-glutamyltransferase family protein [Acholeplasmatales bacterium]|nr:MAG: gamma-glutamyltransferase family protein [Acholeplasmatales bacterium]